MHRYNSSLNMNDTAFKLERDLYQKLSSVVQQPRETVEVSHIIKKEDKPVYCADLFLKNGCKALKMKGPAVIEVKKNPLFDTVSQQQKAFDRIKPCGIKTFILAVGELNGYVSPIKKDGFEVVKFGDFYNNIQKIS